MRASEALKRAWLMANAKPTRYKLGAGGRNPEAPTPFTVKDGVLGSDCIGFVLWCLGQDRYQPGKFPYYDGWINTDSCIADATGKQVLFERIRRPELGALVLFPGIVDRKTGKRKRIGHVGIIVGLPAEWPSPVEWELMRAKDRTALLKQVQVIDCAAATSRRILGRAIQATTAAASWDKPDMVFVRFKGLTAS